MRPPEPIGAQHQLEGFDCGNAALNRWLQQRALANARQGWARTVVLCPDEGNAVIAYACLSAGAIVLGRLAVDRRHQGQGLGRGLVADALRRSLAARRLIGARALLVHAIDEQAAAFYRSLGCRPSPPSSWLTPISKRSWKKAAISRWGVSVPPVMLVRREGESFVALLRRLDRSIAKAWEQEITIDEVNG